MTDIQRYDSDWPRVWFFRYSLIYAFILAALFGLFHDEDRWYLALASYLALSLLFFALRDTYPGVRRRWKFGLVIVVVTLWGWTVASVFGVPGDTKVCWPTYSKVHMWAATVPDGYIPYCDGTPLEDL